MTWVIPPIDCCREEVAICNFSLTLANFSIVLASCIFLQWQNSYISYMRIQAFTLKKPHKIMYVQFIPWFSNTFWASNDKSVHTVDWFQHPSLSQTVFYSLLIVSPLWKWTRLILLQSPLFWLFHSVNILLHIHLLLYHYGANFNSIRLKCNLLCKDFYFQIYKRIPVSTS